MDQPFFSLLMYIVKDNKPYWIIIVMDDPSVSIVFFMALMAMDYHRNWDIYCRMDYDHRYCFTIMDGL
jgi:hypothetical protein